MADQDPAIATALANIEAKTGKTLDDFRAIIEKSGLTKHGEIRGMLKDRFGLGHGHANTVTHLALKSDGASAAKAADLSEADVLSGLYTGKKEHLRPIHDRIIQVLADLGDFDAAPKKTYVSYRRKKQFAMVGPKTNTQVEVGLAAKTLPADPRLKAMGPGSMCAYTTRIGSVEEVDAALAEWLKASYAEAG
ncbi:MAG: DUF4287 domain-containing protein [Gemmatimonadetes bacterium]|nr:DUF4287 domain-containing protein [Gemmatimonadota bacterium]